MSAPESMVTATLFRNSYHLQNNELRVHVVGRAIDGSKVDAEITGTRPHFYVDAREREKIRTVAAIVDSEPGPVSSDGRSTVKVYTRYPFEVRDARQNFEWSGEADIVYPIRTRQDWGLVHVELPKRPVFPVQQVRKLAERPEVIPWTMILDIEVDDTDGFPRPEEPTSPITAVSWWDDHHRQYGVAYTGPKLDESAVRAHFPRPIAEPIKLFHRTGETDVLWGFGQVLRQLDPDAITSWNGYRYDYPYLSARAERLLTRHGGDPDIQRVQDTFYCTSDSRRETGNVDWSFNQNHGRAALIDSLAAYRKNQMRQMSFSLENVAQELLGFGKVERPSKIADLQRQDPARWVAYNLWDTHLVRLIEYRKKLVPLILRWAQLAMVETTDTLHNSRIVDGILFQTARKSGTPRIVLPTARSVSKTEKSRGPVVFTPVVGAFEFAVIFDLKQCYPALIASFGISPDSLTESKGPGIVELPTGGNYRAGGILAEASVDLMAFRDVAKKYAASLPKGTPEREDADTTAATLRHVINSLAGVQTAPHWRMSNRTVFEDITGMSRLQLQHNRDHVEDPTWLKEVTGRDLHGRVLGGDTDAVMVYFTENGEPIRDFPLICDIAWKVRDALNATYPAWTAQFGATRNYTEIGVDGILGHLHTLPLTGTTDEGAKKRYYGDYVLEKDQDVREVPLEKRMKIVGVEYRRFNNAPATREVQLGVMLRFCRGVPVAEIRDWVNHRIEEVPDVELWCACKMGKPSFEEYKSKQPFVRAMMAWAEVTGRQVREEDEFRWAYVTAVRYRGKDQGSIPVFAVPLNLSDAEVKALGIEIDIDREHLERDHWFEEAQKVLPEMTEKAQSLLDDF